MSADKLEKLKQKQAKLEKQLAMAREDFSASQRKIETRKKILIGALFLHEARNNPEAKRLLVTRLDQFLVKLPDRNVFGLPVKKGRVS